MHFSATSTVQTSERSFVFVLDSLSEAHAGGGEPCAGMKPFKTRQGDAICHLETVSVLGSVLAA